MSWEHENGFYLTSPVSRLAKAIAHYELYKKIINLPGQVIECGVFKGASFIRIATYREILESPYSRKIIGFDTFGKFPRQDVDYAEYFEAMAGEGLSVEALTAVLDNKGFVNYELVEGDILQTVPMYVDDHPELKIALLHIDVDTYEPTKAILETLYDRMVKGGLIVFDDYGKIGGETGAVDDFREMDIHKLSISHTPCFTIIK